MMEVVIFVVCVDHFLWPDTIAKGFIRTNVASLYIVGRSCISESWVWKKGSLLGYSFFRKFERVREGHRLHFKPLHI